MPEAGRQGRAGQGRQGAQLALETRHKIGLDDKIRKRKPGRVKRTSVQIEGPQEGRKTSNI